MARIIFWAIVGPLLAATASVGNGQTIKPSTDIRGVLNGLSLLEDEAGRSFETFAENRPQIIPRKLNSDERRSISRLVKAYVGNKDASRGYSQIEPLIQLATSGEKAAMLGLLTAIVEGGVPDDRYGTIDRLPRGPAVDFRMSFREALIQSLLAEWGAHYWNRHGPHRFAASVLAACRSEQVNDWFRCHILANETSRDQLGIYARNGGRTPEIGEVRIFPVSDTAAWFEGQLQNTIILNVTDYSRFKRHAHVSGQLARVRQLIQRIDGEERRAQDPAYKAREAALEAQRYAQYRRDMQALAEREANTPEARRRAQSSREFQQILNNAPSPHAANNANNSQSVTVRNYDKNGNYIGSTTTTRTDAELSGAKPQ